MSCIWHYYKGAHILIQLIVIIFIVFYHRVHEFPDNRMPARSWPTWKKNAIDTITVATLVRSSLPYHTSADICEAWSRG